MGENDGDRFAQYDLEELYANTWTEEDRREFEDQPVSSRHFLIAWALALFLGPFGAQRYYLGRIPTALLKTAMFCTAVGGFLTGAYGVAMSFITVVGAWTIIDLFLLISGTMGDVDDHRLAGYEKWAARCAAITVLVLVSMLVAALVIGTSAGVAGG